MLFFLAEFLTFVIHLSIKYQSLKGGERSFATFSTIRLYNNQNVLKCIYRCLEIFMLSIILIIMFLLMTGLNALKKT